MEIQDVIDDVHFIMESFFIEPERAVKRWSYAVCENHHLPLTKILSLLKHGVGPFVEEKKILKSKD